ncbi:hypothetical protein [Actinoplanes regularis]|uniref:Uncharacterized protein n=1 Tax=Actinoplanes regularis TaxID=52697 RepID=A0A239GVU1_9ACTN|nr:hypothetical protein [Actinoplanes regularis]GIE90888.1 hypothetical protein Are01nite_73680 [Actinoplanes regularis]SNS72643.1 hypothetical protein SAMN06264365_12269 [Actinoplanes regularis]
MQDNHGNEIPIVYFVVAFDHDYGIGALELGGHDYPRSHDDLVSCIDGIRRAGFRHVAITSWIDATGVVHPVEPAVEQSPLDVIRLLDADGNFACGCHGSQREHTCSPLD